MSDTGVGMDAETQSHIFEPFFTTKPVGEGTGLGLSTVYGIVKQSDGYIWVYSEAGVGTRFKVYLPRIEVAAATLREERPAPAARSTETVLLVEDEETLRGLLRETLEGNGYTVLVARDGADALQIADAHAGPIHLDRDRPHHAGNDRTQRRRGDRVDEARNEDLVHLRIQQRGRDASGRAEPRIRVPREAVYSRRPPRQDPRDAERPERVNGRLGLDTAPVRSSHRYAYPKSGGKSTTTSAAQIEYTGRYAVCHASSARNGPRPRRNEA
jgi:CheY-like chemotaxis protein